MWPTEQVEFEDPTLNGNTKPLTQVLTLNRKPNPKFYP